MAKTKRRNPSSLSRARSKSVDRSLYQRIRRILESARSNMARSVNTTQVVANWLIGREIVEEDQKGRRRAEYGRQIIEDIAARLKDEFGAGYSALNLWLFRRFYIEYPRLVSYEIPYALRKETGHGGLESTANGSDTKKM